MILFRYFLCFICSSIILLVSQSLNAQKFEFATKSMIIEKQASLSFDNIRTDWNPLLQNLEMPSPMGNSWRSGLLRRKAERKSTFKTFDIQGVHHPGENAADPLLGQNFKGNSYNGNVPNDNHVSISNEGKLISLINSTIWIYDTEADSLLQVSSFSAFADTLHLAGAKYDPRTIYDPQADRFIVVFLNGFLDSTSRIVLAFSQSNNPAGLWNLYYLSGNPLNNGTWSDYPSIGISGSDLFIGVNTFTNGSTNNSGFVESTFWQIDKNDAYVGNPIISQYYSGLTLGGRSFFNITPISKGSGTSLENDSMILISNRNLDTLFNDSIFLFRAIGEAGQANLDIINGKSDVPYSLPPQARQPKGNEFDTNDSRILAGFYENGQAQYVACTLNPSTGYAGIYHGFIKNPFDDNPEFNSQIIGDTAADLGYPNISYTGKDSLDQEAMLTFNLTSPKLNPSCGAIFYGNDNTYSNILMIHEGSDYVNLISGAYERWGDYSGSQRKYNKPGTIWMSGSYGRSRTQFPRHINSTWIAEITSPDSLHHHIEDPEPGVVAFPNPFRDMIAFLFVLTSPDVVTFSVYDLKGSLVKQLLVTYAKQGRNQFSFSSTPLSTGIYILQISTKDAIIATEKIVKQ